MENKQTAVEWLLNQMDLETISKYDKQLLQAKAMEKEQHGQTWDDAITAFKERGFVESRAICDFDEYYQATYGTNSN